MQNNSLPLFFSESQISLLLPRFFDQRLKKYIFFEFLSFYLDSLDIATSFEENHCKALLLLIGTLIHLYVH